VLSEFALRPGTGWQAPSGTRAIEFDDVLAFPLLPV
jgi:hypothetical protein